MQKSQVLPTNLHLKTENAVAFQNINETLFQSHFPPIFQDDKTQGSTTTLTDNQATARPLAPRHCPATTWAELSSGRVLVQIQQLWPNLWEISTSKSCRGSTSVDEQLACKITGAFSSSVPQGAAGHLASIAACCSPIYLTGPFPSCSSGSNPVRLPLASTLLDKARRFGRAPALMLQHSSPSGVLEEAGAGVGLAGGTGD